jgi:hypothetical protein
MSTAPKATEAQKSIEKKTENARRRSPGRVLLLFVYKHAKTVPIGAPYHLELSRFLVLQDCFVDYIRATHVPKTEDRAQMTEHKFDF